jgi:hypothetical protein
MVKMEGCMIGINERDQVALQEAKRHPRGQALEVPAAFRELNRFLHGKLKERLVGTCLEVVLAEEGHQGFSACRALCNEMERMVVSRKLAKIEDLMTPKFDGTEEEFYGQWRKCEREVALNVNMIGPEFRDDVRIAIVRQYTPPNLESHLQLTAEEYEGSYPRFRTKVEGYFASREQEDKLEEQSSTSALSTDVFYLGKDKGKSVCQDFARGLCTFGDLCRYSHVVSDTKGAGKSTSTSTSSVGCYVCGDKSHRAAKCPRRYRGEELATLEVNRSQRTSG